MNLFMKGMSSSILRFIKIKANINVIVSNRMADGLSGVQIKGIRMAFSVVIVI